LQSILTSKGNKPPWTLPAKAAYSTYDGKRAQKYFGHDFEVPAFFPILSLLVHAMPSAIERKGRETNTVSQPQRALTYIKRQHAHKLVPAFLACFETMWNGQLDISKPENLAKALAKAFSGAEVEEILAAAASPEIKNELTATTERVVKELGAFGCPWYWVTNGQGKSEPFFGSDRFHFMWDFLELPHEDLRLKVEGKAKL
jgi:2-hydroxychromene-2-carboxylate isomerase